MPDTLSNSTKDQALLRPVALWAANYVEQVLPIFENAYPNEPCPRQAVEAAREFGKGKKRDNDLRSISMAAFKLGRTTEEPSKYVTRAACAAAAIAYTHTDLAMGIQGVRQARHILGPIVYAALALGKDCDSLIDNAIANAPPEVYLILRQMPPQPAGEKQEDMLFARLDASLRRNEPVTQ
jgi:hypothetical protein